MIFLILEALGLTSSIHCTYDGFAGFLINILIFLYNFHHSFSNALESFDCLFVVGDLILQLVPVHLNFVAV